MDSNYASAYKLKSGTIDKRLMRVERRSIDWKSQRQDLLQKRRNMSPLAESFQNSSTMSNNKSTMHTPSGKRSEDTENTLKGKTSLKAKTKESDDLKARLSKWKQEKEAKKKLEALEKAKKHTFKTGKLDNKDRLFNIGPVYNNKKSKPVVPHQKSLKEHKPIVKETQPKPTTSTRNLKRKGDDLHSSSTKKQVLGPKNIRDTSTARSLKQRFPERELKKPKTPPSKRITRRTKVVESRLFAATASTAAKQSTASKIAKPAPEKKVTRAAADKKKALAKTAKTLASTSSSMPASDNDTREIPMEKVNVSRGNAYFPEEFSFTAPANLKSYTFNPMSPDSAANFLFSAKDTGTMSFTIDSPEGRCSTPTPRENKKKNNVDDNSVYENLSVTQDVQENAEVEYKAEATTSDSVINTSADDSGNKTTLDNTILERTVIVGNDDNDITVTVTPKKVISSDEEKQVTKTRAGIRKSSRLVSLNDSVSSDSQAEVKPSSPTPGRRRSLRNKSVVTSESSDSEIDSKKRTPRSRRSLRRSVHSKNRDEDHGLPVISEASSPKKNPETISEPSSLRKSTETTEDEELDSILSDSMISKSINKYDDSVFVHNHLKPENKIEKVLPESSSEKNDKASSSVSKIESSISTPKTAKPETTKRLSKSAERTITVQDDGFRTPGAPMSAQRRTRRKTVGSSTPSQARSPEEWVKILAKSPMIEMNRRTPKSKKSPVAVENKIEQPNFDDIEEILNSLQVEPDSTTTSETEIITSDHTTDVHNDDDTKDDVKTSESTKSDIKSVEAANDVSSIAPQTDIASTITEAGENKIGVSNTRSEEIKANEIASTVEEPMEVDVQSSDDVEENGEHDVKYFRKLTKSESNKLSTSNIEWNTYLQENKNLTEEVEGSIRTVVGQSQLLMEQRFKQFTGLIDNCEFKTGEKETKCEDLQGFWDMIYYQVEDVQKKFIELGQRKDKNWVVEEKKEVKKVLKKKTAKTVKPAVKSKFASFRVEMMKQKDAEASNKKLSPQMAAVKTFDAGFFRVNSPVKKTPHFHCEGGTPRKSKVQTEDKESVKHDQKDDTEQMDTEETNSVKVAQVTEETRPENDQPYAENSDEKDDDTNDSRNTKRQPLSVLTPSGHNVRTPQRKSYAPNVPSPLLQDITPKPKTRRSLAANMAAQALDGIDMCPLTSSDTFMTTPKSTGRSKRGTPKTTDETTPRRRSLRVRKSVCFTETPTKKTATEPIVETDDLSVFLQPTIHVSSPVNDNTLILDEDSPFSLKHLEEELSSKKSIRASSRRKSTKRSPSDEKRRRSTRRSVHFDKSPACTQVKSRKNTDELLFTPPQKQTFSTPTSKSRPSLLFSPPGKENTSIDADNLITFTP